MSLEEVLENRGSDFDELSDDDLFLQLTKRPRMYGKYPQERELLRDEALGRILLYLSAVMKEEEYQPRVYEVSYSIDDHAREDGSTSGILEIAARSEAEAEDKAFELLEKQTLLSQIFEITGIAEVELKNA